MGKWPTEFDGMSYQLQDGMKKKWWDVTLNVEEVPSEQYHEELRENIENSEYVLVYKHEGAILHAVYVFSYNSKKKCVRSINSRGDIDQNPRIQIRDICNLYKIKCTATEAQRAQGINNKLECASKCEFYFPVSQKQIDADRIQADWSHSTHYPSLAEVRN